VDKPAGITSHDVIALARRQLNMTRIGHAGTLDPRATGLLLLLVGGATRLLPYLEGEPKEYHATISFGTETSTDDAGGEIVHSAPVPAEPEVRDAVLKLTGEIEQIPPAFSAKLLDGTRAYRAARKGRPVTLRAQRVFVESWDDLRFADAELHARITCAGGTYIRALARDLGRLCNSAAHLKSLRRTRAGCHHVSAAAGAREISADGILPPITALPSMYRVVLTDEEAQMARHGRMLPAHSDSARAALVDSDGQLVAVAVHRDGNWQPRVVLGDV
jgi:tRNA pseudouridine55 synthase